MSTDERHAVLVGPPEPQIARLKVLLQQAGFTIYDAPDAVSALDRVWAAACDLVIVNHPVGGLEPGDLIATVRHPLSPSRNTGLVLVVPPGVYPDAQSFIGRGAIVFGIILMGVSFVMFQKHRTSVVPKRTPNSIITSGPYKYSRNPIYVADAIVLIGYVLTLGSVISFVLVPAFAWVIRKRFINGEEVGIRAEFGQAYDDYCQQTRRWL